MIELMIHTCRNCFVFVYSYVSSCFRHTSITLMSEIFKMASSEKNCFSFSTLLHLKRLKIQYLLCHICQVTLGLKVQYSVLCSHKPPRVENSVCRAPHLHVSINVLCVHTCCVSYYLCVCFTCASAVELTYTVHLDVYLNIKAILLLVTTRSADGVNQTVSQL